MPTLVDTTLENTLASGIYARWKADGVASNGATVTGLTDLSGNGRDLVKAGAGAAITYNSSGPNSKGALTIPNGSMLTNTTFVSTGGTLLSAATFVVVYKALSTHSVLYDGNSGGGNIWVKSATTAGVQELHSLTYGDGTTLTLTRHPDTPAHNYIAFFCRGSTALGKSHASIDWQSWVSTAFRTVKLTLSGNTVGKVEYCTTATGGSQSFVEAIWWDSLLSWHDMGNLAGYLATEYGLYRDSLDSPYALSCWGNSTTENGYPHRLHINHLRASDIPVWNWGISGGGSTHMSAQEDYLEDWATAQRERGKKIVYFLWHGHNDPGAALTQIQSGTSPQAVVRAIGCRAVINTMSVWHNDDSRNTSRIALNDWITASATSARFDAVYDICAADTSLDPDADANEFGHYGDGTTAGSKVDFPDYWYDNVHHKVLGYDRLAERFLSTINTALSAAPGPPVAGTASGSATGTTTASLSSTASSGGYGALTYQWERKDSGAYANVSGATSTTLSDTGLTASTAYTYRLKVSDSAGFYLYSNEVSLTTTAPAMSSGSLSLSLGLSL